ncbi:ribosome biogenesis GTP-binding protein YihA/YsxC [Candidatus Comchoanobacter bicostacola]|uniref:Probable GTP-binding protein EngB n=1 Tax=Candidatus Comchoanobacter bicostacola TaxID=2919598 RepID=A0ABY5DJR3_9GAMM|nr:ribosome biogenesis GTP-binding protein YihA/YsxC [Candidatus Comchoanobacter bicostacola]UTC24531.1 ribosome biogenesis GTP-binding protein YihA/YsxC [Candidatus Comchoanobacter bicostacola]
MKPLQLSFSKSAALYEQLPPDKGNEVVIIGYSNVGKSSLINKICNHKGMAKTSRTPGRTQLLNVFEHDENSRLIDAPGYGFARVSAATRANWKAQLANYLSERQCLKGIIIVIDIRRGLREIDQMVINWSNQNDLPILLVLNKSDKISRAQQAKQALAIKQGTEHCTDRSIITSSCLKSTGMPLIIDQLQQWLTQHKKHT